MKKRRRHTIHIILLFFCVEILVTVGLLAYIQLRPMVIDAVTLEAGSDTLAVEDFLLYKNRKGSFITDVQKLKAPGTYEIKIKIGNRIHTSSLQIIDTTAPTATVIDQMVLLNEIIKPEVFLKDIVDAADVIVSFKEKPDTSTPGDKEVIIVLEDQAGNRTELKAILTILDIRNSIIQEAGSKMDITVDDFVDNDKYDITFITDLMKLDISKPVIHKIMINVNGREVSGNIEVVDTTAPKAVFSNQKVWRNETLPANAFVSKIVDVSGVTTEFKATPDFTKVGDQEVIIVLRDECGNVTEQTVILSIVEDTEAPQIIGARNKTVYIGDGVAYRKGVYVTDNKDKELKVSVDSSGVNLKKAGVYNVIYTAEDSSGNKAQMVTTVTVIKFTVTQSMVEKQADKVLAQITTNNMTKLDKADAIYRWIKKNVGYTGDSDKTNWLAEAYRAFKEGEGDCFTFYAVAQALLTRAGIDNMQVTRLGGKTHHYWNLVDCGDGWYHFDCCPNRDHVETFMLTDAELDAFAATRGRYYYNRDKTLYPATPEESLYSRN